MFERITWAARYWVNSCVWVQGWKERLSEERGGSGGAEKQSDAGYNIFKLEICHWIRCERI